MQKVETFLLFLLRFRVLFCFVFMLRNICFGLKVRTTERERQRERDIETERERERERERENLSEMDSVKARI